MKCHLLAAVFVALISATATYADPLVQYDFTGEVGSQASTSADVTAANLTSLNVMRGAGLNGTATANAMNTTGWNNLETTDYISFGFVVNPGYVANLTNVQFAAQSSATGPRNLGLFYSGDGFTSQLGTLAMATASTQFNYDFNLGSLTNLSGAVEFRIRALDAIAVNLGAVGSAGTFRVNNFQLASTNSPMTVNGTVTAIPEPAAVVVWLVVGAAFAVMIWAKPRRATKQGG